MFLNKCGYWLYGLIVVLAFEVGSIEHTLIAVYLQQLIS